MESPGLPHFNPYFCGGRTLGGDPQIPVFHPLVLLVPLLGPALLLRLEMLAQLALGTWGVWLCMKRWGYPAANRIWGCLLFAAGGATIARYLVGHVTMGFFTLFPLVFYCSYRLSEASPPSTSRWRASYVLLFLYSGLYKPNFFIYGAPLLALEAFFRSVFTRSFRPIAFCAAGLILTGLLCAVTLLPASEYFAQFPRTSDGGAKAIPFYTLIAALLFPIKTLPASWYGPVFLQRHEYSVFVGPVAVGFACLALRARSLPREAWGLAAMGVFSAVLGLGNSSMAFSLAEPFSWFYAFWPGFQSARVPTRLWYGFFLAMLFLSAAGWRVPRTIWGVWVVGVLGILPLVAQATANLIQPAWFASQPQWEPRRQYPSSIVQVHADQDAPYTALRLGQAVIECADNIEAWRSPAVVEGDTLALSRESGLLAEWRGWNVIAIRGHAINAQRVELNLNHHPYWRVTSGSSTIISTAYSRLAIEVPAGNAEVTLTYTQPKVTEGAFISLGTLVLVLMIEMLRISYFKTTINRLLKRP